ncbi:MAG: hypothetical protein R2801_02450 [Chitinophagales bacterium]
MNGSKLIRYQSKTNYSPKTISNTFINTYKTAITAIRNKGIAVPLMIDAYGYADRAEILLHHLLWSKV